MEHATCDMKHTTCNVHRATCNMRHASLQPSCGMRLAGMHGATCGIKRHSDRRQTGNFRTRRQAGSALPYTSTPTVTYASTPTATYASTPTATYASTHIVRAVRRGDCGPHRDDVCKHRPDRGRAERVPARQVPVQMWLGPGADVGRIPVQMWAGPGQMWVAQWERTQARARSLEGSAR
jgi:hypothetical protein